MFLLYCDDWVLSGILVAAVVSGLILAAGNSSWEGLWLSLPMAVAMDAPVVEKQERKLYIPLLETHDIITTPDGVCGPHRKWFAVPDT